MKALVVGLGSMGKRRLRNLRALGVTKLAGVDPRADRRAEAAAQQPLEVFAGAPEALGAFSPDVMIVSTSPELHMDYARLALERRLPCFIEASVVDAERILELHGRTEADGPLMAPSCTMRYFPGPRKVKELVRGGVIGEPLTLTYHTGQYLPDWHPWERIEDYYVSREDTGGCREIVPFELTWLNDLFGDPEPLGCVRTRTGTLNAPIDDAYHFWLRYPPRLTASITVEVLSRPFATRELRILGTTGQLVFSADENVVRVARAGEQAWVRHSLERGNAAAGYINPEEPYIDEMRDFLEAARSGTPGRFPNTLLADYRVLKTLEALEHKDARR